jgi:3-methylfumaryl-CoA hydratase
MSGHGELEAWMGRRETRAALITPWPVAAMAATLSTEPPAVVDGDPLPPMWHWLYFLETAPTSDLGPDGHPRRGGFLPPVELQRRMFAGGTTSFTSPLRIGERAVRTSTVRAVTAKTGRSGPLVFVTVEHEIEVADRRVLTETQDLVYTDAAPGAPSGTPAEDGAPDWTESFTADPIVLFRFSALTFNSHRIHYDQEYAGMEGYPALVVHGPLLALQLAESARRHGIDAVDSFRFRARRPMFAGDEMLLSGWVEDDRVRLVASDRDGAPAVTAEIAPGSRGPTSS